MNIDTEVIWLFITGLLAAIFALAAALAMAARALNRSTEANKDQSDTIIQLNNELQETLRDRAAFRKEMSQVETDLRAVRLSMDEANEKLITQAQDIKALRAINDVLQEQVRELRQELTTALDRIAELKKEALEMTKTITELTSALTLAQQRTQELEARERELREKLQAAYERIAALEQAGAVKDEEIKELKARVHELEIDLRNAQQQRLRLQKERDALKSQLNELIKTATISEESKEPTSDDTLPKAADE